jgi:hypothetical protein
MPARRIAVADALPTTLCRRPSAPPEPEAHINFVHIDIDKVKPTVR